MRYVFENPFIDKECAVNGLQKAPIATNIYETYSQCNEDLIVEGVLRALTFRAGRPMSSVRYIEIGANHPIQTSSTYLLYRVHGASGVLVEPIPRLAENLSRLRSRDAIVNCTVSNLHDEFMTLHVHEKNELSSISLQHMDRFVAFGGREGILEAIQCPNLHINAFMKQYGSGPVDFLSIDIEGFDFDVLSEMDVEYQPAIVQCEHEGNADRFAKLLDGRGYGLIAATDVNVIFLRRGLI